MAIAKMDYVLKAVLSQGNKEQNQAYPPHIFSTHFNLVSSFLVDEIARLYPTSQPIVDTIRPFLKNETLPVKNGMVHFPTQYRHLLGMSIYVTKDFTSSCEGCEEEKDDECEYKDDPLRKTAAQVKESLERGKCQSRSIDFVDQSEFDRLTIHPYKHPTLKKPLGTILQGEGVKICPYDVPAVNMRYIIQPKVYKYGYKMNPDDTYSFDPDTTVESEWTDNATQFLVKGCLTLYANYVKDLEMKDANLELRKAGIF